MNFKRRLLLFNSVLYGGYCEEHRSGHKNHTASEIEARVIVPDAVIESACSNVCFTFDPLTPCIYQL